MIDINSLSKSEILELERQIQEYKKTEKFMTGYKVTFCVKFNPETRKESDICDTESFGQWLCDVIPDEIIKSFNLKQPEDVSGFDVVEMTEDDKEEWGAFYYGWEK